MDAVYVGDMEDVLLKTEGPREYAADGEEIVLVRELLFCLLRRDLFEFMDGVYSTPDMFAN